MTLIYLDALETLKAAKLAYDEGRLSAQGPTPECRYRDFSGRPCAIGAGMTPEQIRKIEGRYSTPIYLLASSNDIDALSWVQQTHDEWAKTPSIVVLQAKFIRVLQEKIDALENPLPTPDLP